MFDIYLICAIKFISTFANMYLCLMWLFDTTKVLRLFCDAVSVFFFFISFRFERKIYLEFGFNSSLNKLNIFDTHFMHYSVLEIYATLLVEIIIWHCFRIEKWSQSTLFAMSFYSTIKWNKHAKTITSLQQQKNCTSNNCSSLNKWQNKEK